MLTTKEQLQIAYTAITHVLNRIHESPEVGYYMGVCTESFDRLVDAYSAIANEPKESVEKKFLPRCPKDPRKELLERIADLERMTSGRHLWDGDECEQGDIGPQCLTADGFFDQVKHLLGEHHADPHKCVQAISALLDIQDIPYPILARR